MKAILLGSGNVATHLGMALKNAGHKILQVWSRNIDHADELAGLLEASAVNQLEELVSDADIYIVSVTDDAIPDVITKFPFSDKLIVHTSGTTHRNVLDSKSLHTGVFYPLQTFSKQREVNFRSIPIAVEGRHEKDERKLIALAETMSDKVMVLDSEQRMALHVAAVLACNFTNHLYTVAEGILAGKGLDFKLILPLIAETANKIQSLPPDKAQTGPAVRNDQLTINKHIDFLKNQPDLQQLYKLLSQNIINFYQKP